MSYNWASVSLTYTIGMLVCHVWPRPLFLGWNWWFWWAMVANYFDYFVFRQSAYSFDGSSLDCSTAPRPIPISFGPTPVPVLSLVSWNSRADLVDQVMERTLAMQSFRCHRHQFQSMNWVSPPTNMYRISILFSAKTTKKNLISYGRMDSWIFGFHLLSCHWVAHWE